MSARSRPTTVLYKWPQKMFPRFQKNGAKAILIPVQAFSLRYSSRNNGNCMETLQIKERIQLSMLTVRQSLVYLLPARLGVWTPIEPTRHLLKGWMSGAVQMGVGMC